MKFLVENIEMVSLTDWISALSSMFMAFAAGYAAWQGIQAWHRETIGKRRIELAEEILADLYEVVDVFSYVRHPMSSSHESADREGRNDEPENLRQQRDTFFIPIKRLRESSELFARIKSRRYRARATFGNKMEDAFRDVDKTQAEIVVAARALMRLSPNDPTDRQVIRAERLEATVWDGYDDNDPIKDRLEKMLTSAEAQLKPIINSGQLKNEN